VASFTTSPSATVATNPNAPPNPPKHPPKPRHWRRRGTEAPVPKNVR